MVGDYTPERANIIRQESLAIEIAHLIKSYSPIARIGLDVGAQDGRLTKKISDYTGLDFYGIEPEIEDNHSLYSEIRILKGYSYDIPFPDNTFDIITVISVIEHVEPDLIEKSMREFYRVLKENGIIVIQMPNMLFPIEPHSILPFQQFLPKKIGKKYLQLFSVNKNYDGHWFINTPTTLKNKALIVGLDIVYFDKFVYPSQVFPPKYRKFSSVLHIFPLDYIMIFKK